MDILSFEGFAGALKDALPVFLGPEWVVDERTTFKINEKKPTLNVYRKCENGDRMMPNIYLDDYYAEYEEGREICAILDEISAIAGSVPDDYDLKLPFAEEDLKKSMIMTVINADINADYLELLPHRRILDLAIVLRSVSFGEDGAGMGIMITREIADRWNLTDDELFEMAEINSAKMVPAYVFDINGIKTVTNIRGMFGAINGFCNKEVMRRIADMADDDLFIIPSSIHEVFVVPASDFDAGCLRKAAVRAAKSGIVAKADFLSENIYRFCRMTGKLNIE